MNYAMMFLIISHILRIVAIFMLPALGISIYHGESGAIWGFAVAIVLMLFVGLLPLFIKPKKKTLYAKEGFVLVALTWITVSLFGAIPFVVSGAIPSPIDAFFETVSGFTTTGASVLFDVEILPKGLLYWRSFTHWLGGMGVLVFLLAVVPLGSGAGFSINLLKAESPGPQVSKMVPRTQSTAVILYLIYIALTVLQFICLLFSDLSVFEAMTLSFATAGTGGFTIFNTSLMDYHPYVHNVTAIFMFLFGINFHVYYILLFRRNKKNAFGEELRAYLLVIAVAVVLITFNVYPLYQSVSNALYHSSFQVVSMITTTSFATVDLELWPQFAKTILLMLMVVGACAGSTSGGIKISRFLILFKYIRNSMRRILRPNTVKMVHLDGHIVDAGAVQSVVLFMVCYLFLAALSMLLISVDNLTMESNLTAVLACLSNTGPGYAQVGHVANYGGFSAFSKLVLCLDMLFGRLEIFPLLMLLTTPIFKRKAQ